MTTTRGPNPRLGQYKVEQRRITHRGRDFHFVSYDAQNADPARGLPAMGPMWYLMNEGARWATLPHEIGQDPDALDRQLARWLDTNVFKGKA